MCGYVKNVRSSGNSIEGLGHEEVKVSMGAPSLSIFCKEEKYEEKDKHMNMYKVMAYLELLIEHTLGVPMKSVSMINAKEVEPCESAKEEMLNDKVNMLPKSSEGSYLST